MSTAYVRLSAREVTAQLQRLSNIIPICEAGTEIPLIVPSGLAATLVAELWDRVVMGEIPEDEVERSLRFADLAGSSHMARVLANEVRRCHHLLQVQQSASEGMRVGQCACTWYDTGGIHSSNCTKANGVALHAAEHPQGPAVAEEEQPSPASIETVGIELPPLKEQDVRHALATAEQMIETRTARDESPSHVAALRILVRAGKEWLAGSGEHEAVREYAEMHRAIYTTLGFVELADAMAMQERIITRIHSLRSAIIAADDVESMRKALGGSEARLAASRTEREQLAKQVGQLEKSLAGERARHGDELEVQYRQIDLLRARINAAADCLVVQPTGRRLVPKAPLANATVIAVHEFSESSEVPNACSLCGWPERSQVHREPLEPCPWVELGERHAQALNDSAKEIGSKYTRELAEQLNSVQPLSADPRDRITAITSVMLGDAAPTVQDIEERDTVEQAAIDNEDGEEGP